MSRTPKNFQDALVAISIQSGVSEQLARAVLNNHPGARHYSRKILEQLDSVNTAIQSIERERDVNRPIVWVCFPRFSIYTTNPDTCMGLGKGAELLLKKGIEPKRQPRPGHENCGWKQLEPSHAQKQPTIR